MGKCSPVSSACVVCRRQRDLPEGAAIPLNSVTPVMPVTPCNPETVCRRSSVRLRRQMGILQLPHAHRNPASLSALVVSATSCVECVNMSGSLRHLTPPSTAVSEQSSSGKQGVR
jgi:hypothetical protein